MIDKLSEDQLTHALQELNERIITSTVDDSYWQIKNGMLHKVFTFKNFASAFGFITQVALIAQRLNHHPDWSNSYKVVELNLSTHKCHGISELDFKLAQLINQIPR